jgi:hypothetical protein
LSKIIHNEKFRLGRPLTILMASTDVRVVVGELHVGGGVAAPLPLLLLLPLHPAAGPDHLLLSPHPLPDLPAKVLLYVKTSSNVVVEKIYGKPIR